MNKRQWRWERYSTEEIATLLTSVLPDLAYVARLKGFGPLAAKLDAAVKELPSMATPTENAEPDIRTRLMGDSSKSS